MKPTNSQPDYSEFETIKIGKPADLPHCSGCTDPNSEGTHQGDTIEHWDEMHKLALTTEKPYSGHHENGISTKVPVERVSEDKTVEGKIEKIDMEWPDEINKLTLAEKVNEIINRLNSK